MQGSGLINQPRGDGLNAWQPQIDDESHNPVLVRTVLSLSRDAIAYWQNMTCFFNRWWTPDPDRVTLPFCFFHTVKYGESHKIETSQKRVIMYEPPESLGNRDLNLRDPVRHGLMQTIVDNAVIQPKEYRLEVIVPFMPFGRYVRQGVALSSLLSESLAFFGRDDSIAPSSIDYIQQQFSSVYGITGLATAAGRAMDDQDNIIEKEIGNLMNSDGMVNKNSLDAMFARGSIVQFKTWMGFDYKYVIIADKTAEKRSTEDDVWRVSLTLKDLPILSLTPARGVSNRVDRAWMINTINRYGEAVGSPRVSAQMPYYRALAVETEAEEGAGDGTDAQ